MASPLDPSDRSALILALRLPDELEALRLRSIASARAGIPAHITLLYPFVDPSAIDAGLLREVDRTVAPHPRMRLWLVEGRRWPDTIYAAVQPEAGLRGLQADLAEAFPSLPLYDGAYPFEPHVSIVEGPAANLPNALDDPAWRALPVAVEVRSVELVVRDEAAWHGVRRFALGGTSDA